MQHSEDALHFSNTCLESYLMSVPYIIAGDKDAID